LDSAVEQRKQIVGDNAFDAVVVAKFQTDPQPLQLWPRQERFALGFKIVAEFAHEINTAHVLYRNRAMLASGVSRSIVSASPAFLDSGTRAKRFDPATIRRPSCVWRLRLVFSQKQTRGAGLAG